MSQTPTEYIDLIPHPLDAWRAALDAVIACAPGDAIDVAWHLADAQVQVQLSLDRSPATAGVRQLIDRLMLITAGRLMGEQLQASTSAAEPLVRKVTPRLTVVVNGVDRDVSALAGVLVGDIIRLDPNNLPPVLNLDQGFSPTGFAFRSPRHQAPAHAGSSAAVDQPDAPSAPGQQGVVNPAPRRDFESAPAAVGHPAAPADSAARPTPGTTDKVHPSVLPAPQRTDQS